METAATISVGLADAGDALALVALGWPPPERAFQLQFLEQLLQSPERDELVLARAYRGEKMVAAALAQRLPGRTAALFPPQFAPGTCESVAAELLAALETPLQAAGVQLVQALLAPDQCREQARLLAAGYTQAATLWYMACETGQRRPSAGGGAAALAWEQADPRDPQRLMRIVEATYEGTLDCPLLNGMRSTSDVLEGYRAVGMHRPELWLIAQSEGRNAGCLLMADHPEQEQLELIYFGVVPEARGKGWGRAIVEHALGLAQRCGRKRVVLAVDAANRPAIQLYEQTGFFCWDQRVVWMKQL
jgi:ribosomal protein S18 acetylase RimI-like enzyme